jgi:hypothetical protein
VQFTIGGYWGPCDLPNVVTISNESGTVWLGGITEFNQDRSRVVVRQIDAPFIKGIPSRLVASSSVWHCNDYSGPARSTRTRPTGATSE